MKLPRAVTVAGRVVVSRAICQNTSVLHAERRNGRSIREKRSPVAFAFALLLKAQK
jgi:hypothetical protein